MKKKLKTAAGILTVIFCVLLGCEGKAGREELLLLPTEEEETPEGQVRAGSFEENTAGPGTPGSASAAAGQGEGEAAGQAGAGVSVGSATSQKVQAGVSAGNTAGQESPPASGERAVCVVHICGAVNHPGVYTMDGGSRIYQAIEEAGGFCPDAAEDYLNQADLLIDGMKVYVPTTAEVEESGEAHEWLSFAEKKESGEEGAEGKDSSFVNINTAGEDALCTLPGIGSSKAKSIIAYREKNGAYQKIEDIMNVEGIKDGVFLKIRDSITV